MLEGLDFAKESDEVHWVEEGGVRVVGIKGLRSYDQYGDEAHKKKNFFSKSFRGNSLNVVMVTKWDGKAYPKGKEKVFLTTLSVLKPLKIIEKYSLRSLIENTAFRELKQGWHLGAIPKKTRNAVTAHIFLTLCMYNMTNAYRTDLGEKLTGKGIRRYRIETFKETRQKIVIIAGKYYGIFDIEEYAILVGNPPEVFWNIDPEKVRRQYGL